MRDKIQSEKKLFIKWFAVFFFALLIICSLIAGYIYQFTVRALEKEIIAMHENRVHEMNRKLEIALQECENRAIELLVERDIQLYFISEDPSALSKDYQSRLEHLVASVQRSYIDSVMLYAPEYEKVYDSAQDEEWYMGVQQFQENQKEIEWIQEQTEQMESDSMYVVRARADRWPYYLSIIRHWEQSSVHGYVCINVDLQRFYEYLNDADNALYEYLWFDSEGRVVINENKGALYSTPENNVYTDNFQVGKSYSVLQNAENLKYAYAQEAAERYGLTCASVTTIDDYFVGLNKIRQQYMGVLLGVGLFVVISAFVLSVFLTRPKYVEKQLKSDLAKERERLRDTQILALQTQLNPHFLFNTLHIISMMTKMNEDHDKTVQMIEKLSQILRYSLSANEMVCIEDEIKTVNNYLYLMECRYGVFDVSVEIDEQVNKCHIPKFALQPLVENALQHGLIVRKKNKGGRLSIRICQMQYRFAQKTEVDAVCIEVHDNGVGMDENKLNEVRKSVYNYEKIMKSHIGLSNVARQFYLFYLDEHKLEIDSVFGKGTTIRIICPMIRSEE